MKYPFEQHFLVCTGSRCNDDRNGSDRGEKIREVLKDHNKKKGRKATIRICSVSCLDLCDVGPNLIVDPGGTLYAHCTVKRALEIYAGVTGDGPSADRLELTEEEFRRVCG